MSALERLSEYSIPKIVDACSAAGFTITYRQRRTKPILVDTLSQLTEEELERIEDAMVEPGQKRRRPGGPQENHRPAKRVPDVDPSQHFMDLPEEKRMLECIENYIDATGNEALASVPCVACARLMWRKDMQRGEVKEIPNVNILVPKEPHTAHNLWQGLLLCRAGIDANGFAHLCSDCARYLQKNRLPPLSLANNMWVGDIPLELRVLSLPERILIAKYIPTAYVVTLIPKASSAKFMDRKSMNLGLRGNVATYPLNTQEIQAMIDNNIMPRPVEILASTIGVTFIGPNQLPARMLPDMFLVRRSRVKRALEWLKENNPIYANVVLSETRLSELPESDVPGEIWETAKYTMDTLAYHQEHEGYVPTEDDEGIIEGDPRGWVFCEQQEAGVPDEEIAPPVVHLHANGVVDIAGNGVPHSELLAHALSNTADEFRHLQKFKVAHGSAFVNEYARVDSTTSNRFDGGPDNANHLLGSFPWLFPYGQGGFEVGRAVDVGYEAHAKWALQYHDKRFRQDLQFAFQLFNVIQKRQVCRGARIEIPKAEFKKHERQIMSLTPSDLLQASKEELRQLPYSNPAVRSLRKVITAVRVGVIGTNESRMKIRSKIWGTCVLHCPPSLWITINPSDTQDPIAQVLAGVSIDMDQFDKSAGLDVGERGKRIAQDPYAGAQYFHLVIGLILAEIMGITSHKGRVKRKEGIFGQVKSYVGAVESQGRGTLHLHLVVWLEHAPTAPEMKEKLQSKAFRDKVLRFIREHIHADLHGASDKEVASMKKESHVAFRRPLDPRDGDYKGKWNTMEAVLARAVQYHTCSLASCQKVVRRSLVCKRNAPFPLAADHWLEPDGNWGPKRTCGFLNNWNPTFLNLLGSNHDLKLISNGEETQGAAGYIASYTAKGQPRSSNTSALLANRLLHETSRKRTPNDTISRNQRMITMCANALNREQEISGPMVMSLLMGWGDTYESHYYVSVYWGSAVRSLLRVFPELRIKSYAEKIIEEAAGVEETHTEVFTRQEEVGQVIVKEGQIVLKNQLMDYQIRGDGLAHYNFLDFVVKTYEGPRVEEKENLGSLRSERVNYLAGHGKDARCRIVRLAGHESLPQFIGPWFPRNDREELRPMYCAQMLMLLRPWRKLEDLKDRGSDFEETWTKYEQVAGRDVRRITQNIQYYYDCSDGISRDVHRRREERAMEQDDEMGDDGEYVSEEEEATEEITEEAIASQRITLMSAADAMFAKEAMDIAFECGIFKAIQEKKKGKAVRKAEPGELFSFSQWQIQLQTLVRETGFLSNSQIDHVEGRVFHEGNEETRRAYVMGEEEEGGRDTPYRPQWMLLNEDQRRAHDIIEDHLVETLRGKPPPQLLMLVLGAGGTGKSLLISAITETFAFHNAKEKLAKTASSGVAASLIGGKTLHSWAGIPIGTNGTIDISKATKKVKEKRAHNMQSTEYLLHDEAWMNGKTILGALSEITSQVKAQAGQAPTGVAFGGMNVIMFGDPHQFPPVRDPTGALYCHRPESDKQRAILGRELYLQFDKVVILKEQKRVQDTAWIKVLNNLREGACDAEDLTVIESTILTNDQCKRPDFSREPWSDAVLVTSRHSVRERWNEAALQRHSIKTGNCFYVARAEDTHQDTNAFLTTLERHVVAGIKPQDTGKLPELVHVAVGMKAMVVLNISTEADIANGTRGVVTDIVLDPRENPPAGNASEAIPLRYPPALIHFKPERETQVTFPGLPAGVIPISPTEVTFTVRVNGQKQRIKRRQLALTAGYAFTDYRSQGQTLEYVIIDLGKPPKGGLTPFSAYVAMSRSRGQETIRILRNGPDALFTTHPSKDLKMEDKRLRALDAVTKRDGRQNNIEEE